MLKRNLAAFTFMTFLSLFSCYGYPTNSDPYYQYSNPNYRFDAVRTPFPEQQVLSREAHYSSGTLNYNYDTIGRASQQQQNLNRITSFPENNTTYTGTSIPPGINDGYNATPSGRYKNAGGLYPSVLNQ
jgi:hypothetical protein